MRFTSMHTLLVSASVLVMAGLAASATAKSIPVEPKRAVSAPNLKVSGYGGAEDGQTRANVAAQASVPLGDKFGAQLDGLYGYGDGNENNGIGGHLFYRDPTQFLAGITAMTAKQDSTEFNRFGIESEIYLDDFTLAPSGGYQDGDNRLGNSIYYTLEGAYYPNDNLKYSLGATGFDGNNMGFGKTEWQPNTAPYTVFAFAGAGNEGNAFLMAGASYTFGAPATTTLKKRDRTGDPENIVKTAASFTGSVINKATKAVGSAATAVGNSMGNMGNSNNML